MPPIDAGIYGSAPRPQSVAELTNALLAQDANGLNNRLMAQKAQEYQAVVLRQQQVRNALAGLSAGANEQERIKVLEGTATPEGFEQADKMRKTLYERQKSDAEVGYKVAQTKKEGVETQGKSLENLQKSTAYAASQLGRVNVQDDNAVADLYSDLVGKGVLTRDQAISEINRIPAAGPARDQWKQQQQQSGLTMLEQINAERQKQQQAEQVRQFGITSTETGRHNRTTEGISGAQLDIARERERREAQAPKGIYDSERGILIDPRSAVATGVTAGGVPIGPKAGADKMTEDQGKATGWLVQAENAFKNMKSSGFDDKGNAKAAAYPGPLDAVGQIPGMGAIANLGRSGDRQSFIQASESLSEALLRAATGAGVNKDEAAQKVRELTPAFGERAEVTKQKMDAIPLYIESLKVRAGPGAKKADAIRPSGPKPIASDAEYNSLSSGAEFIAPDGSHRRKP